MPLIPTAASERRDARDLSLFGKIAEGTTLKSAATEMDFIARQLAVAYPETNKDIGAKVMTFAEYYNGGKFRAPFTIMLWAVAFVLMIACANVANMVLARAVGRAREISIRAALGASRWRVIRQLLVESMILSVAGGGLGWLAAVWGARAFDVTASANGKPAFMTVTADYTVLAYMAVITLGTGILFGLAPALRLSKLDINLTLKDGGHGTSGGKRGKYLSSMLVVAEMSLAVVLLVGAGLMIQSFMNIFQAPIGVRSDHVLTMRMFLPTSKYARPGDEIAFCDRLEERLASVPGVDSVAVASNIPARQPLFFSYELEGAPATDLKNKLMSGAVSTSPAYFHVMGVVPHAGRSFTESDGVAGYPVVIVNDSFAATFWPHESPLGKRLRLITPPGGSLPGTSATPQPWLTVVGVVPNIVQNVHTVDTSEPLIYLPYRQLPVDGLYVFARTNVPPGNLAEPFRRAVVAVDEDLPIVTLESLDEALARVTWGYRVFGAMFGSFGTAALVLASVGLYSVIAHSVSRRTQEFGVRIALGATAWGILRLVFSQAMKQLGIGLAVGSVAAFGVTEVLTAMLVGVKSWDPVTFISVACVLTLAGALGCVIPARRAIRVDPVVALRHD
jgi:predicted permease